MTLHLRDQQLEVLQQEQLDLLKQFASSQEAVRGREQALSDLQVHFDELQARLEELQLEAASRDDTIRFLQNEKIVLEVALQAAKSSEEEFDRGAKRLEGGAEETLGTLEQLRQELAVRSSQVTCFAVILSRIEVTPVRTDTDRLVLYLNTLFCKCEGVRPGQGPGLSRVGGHTGQRARPACFPGCVGAGNGELSSAWALKPVSVQG